MTHERTSFYSSYLKRTVTILAQQGTIRSLTLDEPQRLRRANGMTDVARACQAYLAGGNVDLREYSVDLTGISPFEQAALTATREIPRGCVATYSALAARIGRPRAARAVGNALAKNPAPLFIPCHRVVGVGGIGGFSCGLDVKVKLLQLEVVSRE